MSEEDTGIHCDCEKNCANFMDKCFWCVREYDAEFEGEDYYSPIIVTESIGGEKK